MKYEEGKVGRIFTLRLEESDPVYECIEKLCTNENLERAVFWIIGGSKNGKVVIGPEDSSARPLKSLHVAFSEAHEILGTGTIFPNSENKPTVHMHASFGHGGATITGCPRINLECWLINEVIILEMTDLTAKRLKDENGFELLTLP